MSGVARGLARGDAGGRKVFRLDESPSTNDEVRRRFAADASGRGLPHLSSVVTDHQTAGRGRLGREWVSPPGTCLAVSTVLRLAPDATGWLGWLPLAGGLALRDALVAELGAPGGARAGAGAVPGRAAETETKTVTAAARVRMKWPNDVLVDGRKIAGILGEVLAIDERGVACVLGTGINLTLRDDQLPVPHATSLAIAGVDPVDAGRVERRYLAALERRIDALVASGGDAVAAGLHGELSGDCSTLGTRVRVALPGGDALVGEATAIDRDGHLEVRDDAGRMHVVTAGDVERVRPASD